MDYVPYESPIAMRGSKPAVTATRFTEEEKDEALKLYVEQGLAEASRQTGINKSTIGNWANQRKLSMVVADNRRANVEALKLKWQERRARLAEDIGETAEDALDLTRAAISVGDARSARDAAGTLATLVDKAQLLTGGPTERIGMEERFADREQEIAAARLHAQEVASAAARPELTPAPEAAE